jgi:hypothetical protein
MSVVAQLPPEMGGASGKVSKSSSAIKSTKSNRSHISIPRVRGGVSVKWRHTTDYPVISGTFRPDRIRSIAERFGVDGNMALENILYGIFLTVYLPGLKYSSRSACLQQRTPGHPSPLPYSSSLICYRWSLSANVPCVLQRTKTSASW